MAFRDSSDENLIQAFRQKSVAALEEFYDRHHRTALAVAYRILWDQGAAEDVVQEAFLAAWRQADRYQLEEGAARSWFFSIVRHRAIDVTRGRAFSRERFALDESAPELDDVDVEQQVNSRLEKDRIREAVQALPEEQRETVFLAYFSGYTHQEIAQRTGVPLGTVKGRIRLAMEKLRNTLADLAQGGPN
jgi:RNA polymerase sigma-70 factor (ECF subfamily)